MAGRDDDAPERGNGKGSALVRRERLAAALRANLARRKEQARRRNDAGANDETGPSCTDATHSPESGQKPAKDWPV